MACAQASKEDGMGTAPATKLEWFEEWMTELEKKVEKVLDELVAEEEADKRRKRNSYDVRTN